MAAAGLDLKRVLLCDNVDTCCKDILQANGIAVDVKNKLPKEELLAEIKVHKLKYIDRFRLLSSLLCRSFGIILIPLVEL